MKTIKREKVKLKAKRTFMKKGTCSRTFYYLMNREFGHTHDDLETAADPLAGGIAQQGYQCGMLWGAVLAVGSESYKKYGNSGKAIRVAVKASNNVRQSFVARAKTTECHEITKCDWSKKNSIVKFMFSGKMVNCFRLAGKWAPEAIDAALEGLITSHSDDNSKPVNCASLVAEKMGAGIDEVITVAGLAGGIGLSGGGCGALAAAIWVKTLERVRKGNWKYTTSDETNNKILSGFYKASNDKMECSLICNRKFNSIDEHSEYIKNGGCKKIIEILASS